MDTDQLWSIVEDQRRRVAAFLEPLTASEWTHPSLCDGWTVKDVAAHLAVVPHAPSLWRMLPMVLRARGSLDRNALERAWAMGWPFHARRKLAGYRLWKHSATAIHGSTRSS